MTIGKHEAPVKDVCSFQMNGNVFVVSGGWDALVKFYHINNNQAQQVGESWVAKPVHYMACSFPVLVTAHSEKWCHVWNLQNCSNNQWNPVTVVESPLKYQTSTVGAFGDGKGFAIGSIEGRCAIMTCTFAPGIAKEKICDNDFCFKCHRVEQ